jgi:hypothetical protein
MANEPTPAVEPEAPPRSTKMEKAAHVATLLLRHKQLLVAAMEVLREQKALSEDEEVKVMTAYEQGSVFARSAIHDLLERLQKANLGKVVIALKQEIEGQPITPDTMRGAAQPYIAAAKDMISGEARPYIERAKQRLVELKALEEPTLRRLESVSENFRLAGKEVAVGLKGAGREAADELIKRGKRLWMSAETEELERELFDWVLKTAPKAENALVRSLIGSGLVLLAIGVLVAAQQVRLLKEFTIYGAIFLLVFLGLAFLNWGLKLKRAMAGHRSDIERIAKMTPQERRLFLTKRWANRAQAEGLITSNEAQTVIEQTVVAAAEDAGAPAAPAR